MGFLSQIGNLDVSSLGLLQRLLLISDGTLTDVVEAAFLEPIALVKIAVSTAPATAPIEALEINAGATLMRREILLQGKESGANYVYAESLIAVDWLPGPLRHALINSGTPLGRLWIEHKLETRKEILEVWTLPAGELAVHFGCGPDARLLARSYRVFSGGRPIMLINEYFPAIQAATPPVPSSPASGVNAVPR